MRHVKHLSFKQIITNKCPPPTRTHTHTLGCFVLTVVNGSNENHTSKINMLCTLSIVRNAFSVSYMNSFMQVMGEKNWGWGMEGEEREADNLIIFF